MTTRRSECTWPLRRSYHRSGLARAWEETLGLDRAARTATERAADPGVAGTALRPPVSTPALSPARVAGWVWLLCSSLFAGAAIQDWLRVRRWLRAGRLLDDEAGRAIIARARSAVGLRRAPRVLVVPDLDTPVVTGLFRPAVLLPALDLTRWGPAELEMALAHEMAHVARGDLWLGLVPAIARRVFFFHPAAWIAEREFAIAREAACDATVLGRVGADAVAYGRLLLRLTTRRLVQTAIPMSPHSMLRRRLEMIDTMVRRVPIGRAGWILVAVAALAIVPVRLVAKEPKPVVDQRCLDIGSGKDNAYVVTDGRTHSTCGDIDDISVAAEHRVKGQDVIWFRVDGKNWVVRDPAVVAEAQRLFAGVSAVGEQQAKIGAKQAQIGLEQSVIGSEQGEIGVAQSIVAQQQAAIALQQASEALRRAKTNDEDDAKDAAAEAREQAELERARAEIKVKIDETQIGVDVQDRMTELGARMELLGQLQAALGERQRVLGEKIQREIAEAQTALSQLLERAIREGTAVRAD